MNTVIAIIAGAPIQLAGRFEVRRELTNESVIPIKIAEGTPRKSSARNVKVSPAVKLEWVLGMRIGLDPARITSDNRPANSAHSIGERSPTWSTAPANTASPTMTIHNQ
jgi:hypothetical protein